MVDELDDEGKKGVKQEEEDQPLSLNAPAPPEGAYRKPAEPKTDPVPVPLDPKTKELRSELAKLEALQRQRIGALKDGIDLTTLGKVQREHSNTVNMLMAINSGEYKGDHEADLARIRKQTSESEKALKEETSVAAPNASKATLGELLELRNKSSELLEKLNGYKSDDPRLQSSADDLKKRLEERINKINEGKYEGNPTRDLKVMAAQESMLKFSGAVANLDASTKAAQTAAQNMAASRAEPPKSSTDAPKGTQTSTPDERLQELRGKCSDLRQKLEGFQSDNSEGQESVIRLKQRLDEKIKAIDEGTYKGDINRDLQVISAQESALKLSDGVANLDASTKAAQTAAQNMAASRAEPPKSSTEAPKGTQTSTPDERLQELRGKCSDLRQKLEGFQTDNSEGQESVIRLKQRLDEKIKAIDEGTYKGDINRDLKVISAQESALKLSDGVANLDASTKAAQTAVQNMAASRAEPPKSSTEAPTLPPRTTPLQGNSSTDAPTRSPTPSPSTNELFNAQTGNGPDSNEETADLAGPSGSDDVADTPTPGEDEPVLSSTSPDNEAEEKPELPKHLQEKLDKFKDAGHKLMGNDHQAKQQKYADRADAANTKSFGDLYKEDMKSSWGRIKDTFQNAEVAKDENEAFAQLLMLLFEMIAFMLSPLSNVANAAGDKAKNAIKEQFWNALSDIQGNKFNDPSNQQKVLKGLEGQRDDIENKIAELKEKQAGQEPGSVDHKRTGNAIKYEEAKLDVVNDSIAKTDKHLNKIQGQNLDKREKALLDQEKKLGEKDATLKQELADLETEEPKNENKIKDLKEEINRNDEKIQRNHNELDRIGRDRKELQANENKGLRVHNPDKTEKELDKLTKEQDKLDQRIKDNETKLASMEKGDDKTKLQAKQDALIERKGQIDAKVDDKSKELEKSLVERQQRLAEDREVLKIQAKDDRGNDREATLKIQDDLKNNAAAQKETGQKLDNLRDDMQARQDQNVTLGDAPNPEPQSKEEKLQSIDDQIEDKKEELDNLREQRGNINGEMQELERNRTSPPGDDATEEQKQTFAQQESRYNSEKQRLEGERDKVDDQISKVESDIDKLSREKQEVGFDSPDKPKEEQLEARSRSLDSNQEETAIEGDNLEDAIDDPEEIAAENQRVARERGTSPSSTDDDEVLSASAPEAGPEEENKEENTEEAEEKPELPKHYQDKLDKFKAEGHKLMGNDHEAKQQKYADRADAANTKSFGDLYKEDMKSSWGRIKDTFQNAEVAKDENEAFAQLLMLMFEMIAFALSPLTNVGNAAGDKAKNAIKEQFWNALADMQGDKFNDPANQQKVLKGLEGQRDNIENKIAELKEKQAGQEPGSVDFKRSTDAINYQQAKLDVVNDSIEKTEKHLKNIQGKDLDKREKALLDQEKKLGEKDATLKQNLADLESEDNPKNEGKINKLKDDIKNNDEKIQRNHNELDRINRDREALAKPDSGPIRPHNPEKTEKELDKLTKEQEALNKQIGDNQRSLDSMENGSDKNKLQAKQDVLMERKDQLDKKVDDKTNELKSSLEEEGKRLEGEKSVQEIQNRYPAKSQSEHLERQDNERKLNDAIEKNNEKLTKLNEQKPDKSQDSSVKLGDAPPNPIEKTEKELADLNKEKAQVDKDIAKSKESLAGMDAGPEKDKLQKEQDALKERSKDLREKIGNKENEYVQQLEGENQRLEEQKQDVMKRPQSGSNLAPKNDLVEISDAQNANQDKINALRTQQNARHREEQAQEEREREQQRQEENDRLAQQEENDRLAQQQAIDSNATPTGENALDADSPSPQGPSDPSDEQLEQSIGSDVSDAADKKRAARAGAPAAESEPSADNEGGPRIAAAGGAGAGALASEDAQADEAESRADEGQDEDEERTQALDAGEEGAEEEAEEEDVLKAEGPKPEEEPEAEVEEADAKDKVMEMGADEEEEPEAEVEEADAKDKVMEMGADEEEEPEAEAEEADAKDKVMEMGADEEEEPEAEAEEADAKDKVMEMGAGEEEEPEAEAEEADAKDKVMEMGAGDDDGPDPSAMMEQGGDDGPDPSAMMEQGGGDEQMEMGSPSPGGGGGGGMPSLGGDDEEKPKEKAKDDKGDKKGKEEEKDEAQAEEDPMTEVSSKMLEMVQKAFESITNPSSAMGGDEAKKGMDMEGGGGGMEMPGGGGGDGMEMGGGGGGMEMPGGGGGGGKDKKEGKGKDDPMSKIGEGLPKEGKQLVGGICKAAGFLAQMAQGADTGGGNDAKKGEEAGKQLIKVLEEFVKAFKGGLQGGMGGGGAKPGGGKGKGKDKGEGKGQEGPGGGGAGGLGADGGGDMAEGMGGAEMAGDMDGGMNPMSMAKDAQTLKDPDATKGEKAEVAGKWAARAMGVPPPADAMVGKVVKAAVDKMEEMDPGKKLQQVGEVLSDMGEACHEATKSKEPDPGEEASAQAETAVEPVTNMRENTPMPPMKPPSGGGMGMDSGPAPESKGPGGPSAPR
ncbi:MAG: hypothetical protein AB7I18_05970 [Candidatus Berkiella sp.]